jgi:holo-[acyl-carrier protein] synthase
MLVSRMEKSMANEAFVKKVFSAREREYIDGKGQKAQTAAGMFGAKEAFLKALGTGIGPVPLCEVEILHDENGAPLIEYGKNMKIHVSISHMGDIAVAQVIIESGKN